MRICKWKWKKMKKIDWKGWRMLLSGFRKDRKKKGKECTKNHLNIQNIKVMMTILLTDVSKLRKKKRKKRDKVRNKLLKNNKWPSWINSWNKHCQQQKSNTNLSLMTLIYFPCLKVSRWKGDSQFKVLYQCQNSETKHLLILILSR